MWLFSIPSLESAAKLLRNDCPRKLPYGITAILERGSLRLECDRVEVFHMKVKIIGEMLDVDYPRTTDGHGGAGWGHLGMVLALLYGQVSGCTAVSVNTLSEATPNALKYWARYKLKPGSLTGSPIKSTFQAALDYDSSTDQIGVRYIHVGLS